VLKVRRGVAASEKVRTSTLVTFHTKNVGGRGGGNDRDVILRKDKEAPDQRTGGRGTKILSFVRRYVPRREWPR